MTALLTIERYQAITGDRDLPALDFDEQLAEAQALLEDELDRPLDSAERAEVMHPTQDGRFYPHAIPVTSASGYLVDGVSLIGQYFNLGITDLLGSRRTGITITYVGGWVERTANPLAANRLPICIERDLAWVTKAIGNTSAAQAVASLPLGSSSVRLGDVSVTYAKPSVSMPPSVVGIVWSPKTCAYRYFRVGGYDTAIGAVGP